MPADPDDADPTLEQGFLRRALQDDREAFRALASMNYAGVYAIARNLCSSDLEALEVTQAAFRTAWNQIDSMPADLSFRGFACRFVVREAVERLRCAGPPAVTCLDRFVPAIEAGNRPASSAGGELDVETLANRPDILERLADALALLDREDRAAFVLRVVNEVPMNETAAILEMPISQVRARTHRASLLISRYLSNLATGGGKV
jgi:RNA polymerase sigma-70 factor, ECF subfamily